KAEELKQMLEQREEAEKEELEPKAIREKGYEFPSELICLGSGSFSEVYLMKNKGVDIAAKVIELERTDNYVARFFNNSLKILELVASKHRNIIRVMDIFRTNKRAFIMMECAAKGSVFDYLNDNGAVDEQTGIRWLVDTCKGLNFLHTNEVAHRNIRTENLLIDANLTVKIGGFSFSRLCVNPKNGKAVYSGTSCGAQPYYAPEILKGERYDPKASDIWSAGVVFFVSTQKRYPFDYRDYTIQMQQQMGQEWKSQRKLVRKLSDALMEVLSKMFDSNFKSRIKVRQVLKALNVGDKDLEEAASVKQALMKKFAETGSRESVTSAGYMSSTG
ncbi:testis-specific serine/threonine-protein kinase 6-like protein, partial [Leptotrombidium deliense]